MVILLKWTALVDLISLSLQMQNLALKYSDYSCKVCGEKIEYFEYTFFLSSSFPTEHSGVDSDYHRAH